MTRFLLTLLFSFSLLGQGVHLVEAGLEDRFMAANGLFNQGKFAEARAAYEALLNAGKDSASLRYNLAQTDLQLGSKGLAVVNLRQAQRLAPHDREVLELLGQVRTSIPQSPPNSLDVVARFGAWFSMNGWTALGVVGLWGICLLLAAKLLRKRPVPLGGWLLAFSVTCLLLALGGGRAYWARFGAPAAVSVTKECKVRFGPLDDAQVVYSAQDGAEFAVMDRFQDWAQIKDRQGREGWVKLGRDAAMVGFN